jgi:predicted mannosyl-3-phosphoglycerate phosphatase (HAD superfamily)
MTKLTILGVVITVYGLIALVGAAVKCPAKYAAIPISLFILLTGIAFYALGRELEEIKKKK